MVPLVGGPPPPAAVAGGSGVVAAGGGVVVPPPGGPPLGGGAGELSVVLPQFSCPRRPNVGTEGRPILLRANHFQISMPRGFLHHYDVTITPDKCPRKVNREIIETMVQSYSKIFGSQKPVFDGRKNMYTRDDLPIGKEKAELEVTLPGEGKDRVFRVAIKWVAQVSAVARGKDCGNGTGVGASNGGCRSPGNQHFSRWAQSVCPPGRQLRVLAGYPVDSAVPVPCFLSMPRGNLKLQYVG